VAATLRIAAPKPASSKEAPTRLSVTGTRQLCVLGSNNSSTDVVQLVQYPAGRVRLLDAASARQAPQPRCSLGAQQTPPAQCPVVQLPLNMHLEPGGCGRGVADGVAVRVTVGVRVSVGVNDEVALPVGVREGVPLALAVRDGVDVAVKLAVADGVAVQVELQLVVTVLVGVGAGERDIEGSTELVGVPVRVPVPVPVRVRVRVALCPAAFAASTTNITPNRSQIALPRHIVLRSGRKYERSIQK
jgi:hypothetical protein